jgi:hypothetical protein
LWVQLRASAPLRGRSVCSDVGITDHSDRRSSDVHSAQLLVFLGLSFR